MLWEDLGRNASGFVPHQFFFVQIKRFLRFFTRVFMPLLQLHHVVDIRRNQLIIESDNQLLVHQHIDAARLVLKIFNLANQFLVISEEG